MKQHLKWFRTLWLIVCFIIFGCVSSISAETATTIELFAVQETVWEEHVDSYSVRLTVRNQSGGIILDPSACVCFMDPSETIVETSIVQQHGRLRNEQALIFVAEISRSLNPDSVYVDYVQYKDEAANIQTFYFNEPTVMKRIVEPVIEQSPRQSNEATTPVILPDEETLSAKTTEKSSEHVSIIDGNAPWLQLSESSLLLVKGKTATLKASVVNGDGKKASYTWESSNPSVAKVSKGTVSAVDGGKATISCRAVLSDGSTVSASIDVTVTVPVKSLKRGSLANITMKAGNSTKIDYTLFPANATVQTLEWSSSDPDIAQVDANGTVTAVSAGKAKITATTQDGTRKSIQVSIYIPSLECSDKSAILNNTDGETLQIYYYGRNWNKDIEIHKSKDFFDYTLRQDGTLITIHLMAKSVGSGSLTITDKKDKKSKVVVSVRAERSALPFYRYMTINDSKRVYDGVMRLVFQNNTDVTIIGNTFARKFYDKSGKRIYYDGDYDYHGFNNNNVNKLLAGKTEEWYYDGFIRWGVGPGEDVWSWDYFEIALTGIKLSDGTSIRINEKDYCWFSTKLNSYILKEDQHCEMHTISPSVREKSANIDMGFWLANVLSETAHHNGYNNTGYYIDGIQKDAYATSQCFKVGDMIFEIDGIRIVDDPYALEKGLSKMADGEDVVFSVERPGVGNIDYSFTYAGGRVIETTDSHGDTVPSTISAASDSTTQSNTTAKTSAAKNLSEEEYNKYAALFIGVVKGVLKKPDSMEVHWVKVMEYNDDLYT